MVLLKGPERQMQYRVKPILGYLAHRITQANTAILPLICSLGLSPALWERHRLFFVFWVVPIPDIQQDCKLAYHGKCCYWIALVMGLIFNGSGQMQE